MAIYELDGVAPVVTETTWVADSAEVVGNVRFGENTSVWFGVIIRADNEPMNIGAGTNIQEGAVLHSDPGKPLTLGENVTIGHKAMLHGCVVGNGSLIGIGAVILNGATIGKNCLVGAGALVTEGKVFPDGMLIVGSPAVAKREMSPEAIKSVNDAAHHYIENAKRFRTGLKKIA